MTFPTRLIIACAAVLSPCAHALTVTATKIDIIVTGSRTGLDARDMTDVYSTVPFIDQLPISAASDLLKFTPGLSVSRQGPVGSLTQVRIRGSEANQTLVFIDGIEANDPAAGEFDFSGLSAVGAQRIDILRGPQSALWGTEAIGGVVSITTQNSDDIYAHVSGGSHGRYSGAAGAGYRGAATQLAAHINYDRTSGVSVARQGREKDGYSSFNAALVGKTEVTDIFEIGGSARYQTNKIAFDDFVGGTVFPLVDADLTSRAQRFYGRGYARLKTDLDAINWSHEANVRFVDTRNENNRNALRTSTTFGNRIILGYQTALKFDDNVIAPSTDTDNDEGISYTRERDHHFVGAIEYRRERFRNDTLNASPFFDPNQRQNRSQLSLIGEYRLRWDDFRFAGSLRRDDNDGFKDTTTWRASARYDIFDGAKVRASYGTAVTNPTFFEQFGFAPASFVGNPNVKPERGQGFDIGFDSQLGDATLKVTYFNMRLEDEIISVFNPDFTSSVANAANKPRRAGVEVEGFWQIESFQFSAGYTYTKSSEPRSRSSAVQVKELRRPDHTASLAAVWTGMADKLSITGALAYQGRNNDVAFDANFSRVPVTLSGYVSASAQAAYKFFDTAEVFASVENAFDVRAEDVFGYAQPGIAVRAGVRLKFGQ